MVENVVKEIEEKLYYKGYIYRGDTAFVHGRQGKP
jgi:hypothetical protein